VLADGVAQVEGPDHEGEQRLPEAQIGIGQGEQPADEPDRADDVGLYFDGPGLIRHSPLLFRTRSCAHDTTVDRVVPDGGLTRG
jgi:hypothetical protein